MTANTTYDSLLELINDSNRKRLLKVDITHHAALGKEVRTASGSTQNASIFTAVIDDNRSEMLDGFNRNLLADPQQKRDRYMFIVGSVGTGKTIITTVMINHALTSGALIIFLDGAELIDNPIDRIRESFVDWNDRRFTGHAPFDQLKRQVEAMQTAQHLSDFLRALARQRDFPVAFVVDEAQMVYEHAQPDPTAHDGKSLQQLLEAMPQPQAILLHLFFINKDILRSTNRLALVIAGSANSRWERYLKGNERDSLFLCTPFNEECFHLQINLLPNYYESLSLLTDAERKELKTEVYNVTRGTLRHIRDVGKLLGDGLKHNASIENGSLILTDWTKNERSEAKKSMLSFYNSATKDDKLAFFQFLFVVFRHGLDSPLPELYYKVYDKGPLTKKGRNLTGIMATSLGAEQAVLDVYLLIGGKKRFHPSDGEAHVRGAYLESSVISALLGYKESKLTVYELIRHPGGAMIMERREIPWHLPVRSSLLVTSTEVYRSRVDPRAKAILYIPDKENFPGWDFIAEVNIENETTKVKEKHVHLGQISLQNLTGHEGDSSVAAASMKNSDVRKVLKVIAGAQCEPAYDGTNLVVHNAPQGVFFHFLYFAPFEVAEILQDIVDRDEAKKKSYDNLRFLDLGLLRLINVTYLPPVGKNRDAKKAPGKNYIGSAPGLARPTAPALILEDQKWQRAFDTGVFGAKRLTGDFTLVNGTEYLLKRGWVLTVKKPKKAHFVRALADYIALPMESEQGTKRSLTSAGITTNEDEPPAKRKKKTVPKKESDEKDGSNKNNSKKRKGK